jgi:hypothetical protein
VDYHVVDDKQIAEVGFGDGQYGPATLGIKFKPWKPENPITEYHYGNVTPELHAEMLAAKDNPEFGSIHKFFNAKIKKLPEQFPYTKIDRPTNPIGFDGDIPERL